MKIRVSITLDVDPDAYAAEYGVPRSEIRSDVQTHAQNIVCSHFESLGVLA